MRIKKIPEIADRTWHILTSLNGKRRIETMFQYYYGEKVLEVGVGTGFLAVALIKANDIKDFAGIDISEKNIEICKKLFEANNVSGLLEVAKGENLPYVDGLFDTVILPEILEHVHKPELIIQEANRVLKDCGQLIISVPAKGVMPPGKVTGHVQDFSKSDMEKLITENGFILMHHRQVTSWNFYLGIKKH